MQSVCITFEVFDENKTDIPPGFQYVDYHILFDIKMRRNFRRKARIVAGKHKTSTPLSMAHFSVVSIDSVRIFLTIPERNGLNVIDCDIQNAYLPAKRREKSWTIVGPQFGTKAGKTMIILCALYGLKSRGVAFRELLAEVLNDAGYMPSNENPDV